MGDRSSCCQKPENLKGNTPLSRRARICGKQQQDRRKIIGTKLTHQPLS
ncbi:MAG TPA: hypothetical protein VKO20_00405 [Desulfosalsimonadaceae bacterium]|nr:hypothetical protein [Desulfosalsimonadaceae bacterium]